MPPNSTVVGCAGPGSEINGKPVENAYDCTDSVDQVHISDPVEDEIGVLTARIRELEADLAAAVAAIRIMCFIGAMPISAAVMKTQQNIQKKEQKE